MTDHKDLIERLLANGLDECDEAADALESAQPQCVEVKPLVWERCVSVGEVYEAKTSFGEYVCGVDDYGFAYGSDTPNGDAWADFDSLEYAKAAAQTDYDRRVLASITTRSVSDVWTEATAAAYEVAIKAIQDAPAGYSYHIVEHLTPQSARDWLAEREAAIRADERAKVIEEAKKVINDYPRVAPDSIEAQHYDEQIEYAEQCLDTLHTDASRAIPIKEKDE